MVVGESHRQEALVRLAGGKKRDACNIDCIATLTPEPSNPFDSAAVMVTISGQHVGYLSRGDARSYRPIVDAAIAESGAARVHAAITGGWSRGEDEGHFGVDLFFAEHVPAPARSSLPEPVPGPKADEIRLRGSTTVSVSDEEHYQAALVAATRGQDLSRFTAWVLADLVEVPENPHAKKPGGAVVQVRVDDAPVGHLTPAMSERFRRVVQRAQAEGKRLTCGASIFQGAKAGAPILEIRLSACPHAHDELHVTDPFFEIVPNLVMNRKTRKTHFVASVGADGSVRTRCGNVVKPAEVIMFASTKPDVGQVDPTTRELVGLDLCVKC